MASTTTEQTRNILTDEELSVLYYELSQLGQSGISWTKNASLLLNGSPSRRIRLALEALHLKTTDDSSFAAVLQATKLFPSYCIHMLRIGELTGRLDTVLIALSDYYKRERTLNETIQRAVTYPYVMTTLTALIFLILLQQIFPIFSQVFSLFNNGISLAASFLLGQSPAGLAILTGVTVAPFLVVVLALILFHSRWGLAAFSRGRSSMAIGWTRFASTMSLIISSGLRMDGILEQIGKLLEETPLASMCVDCQKRISDGVPSTEAVAGSGIFSGTEAGALAMGFRIGAIKSMVEELARRNQLSADVRLNQPLNCFECGLMVLLCVTVGGTLLIVMLSLLRMLTSFGG